MCKLTSKGNYVGIKIIAIILETDFEEVTHSLDVWHKAKSIKKCLDKVSLHQIQCSWF
jgi:hypothetical protein